MKRAAAAFALMTFVGVPTAWADDESPEAAPPKDSAPNVAAASEQPKADSSASGEITLDNAAVNRAFANGELPSIEFPVRPHRFGAYLGFRAINIKDPGYDPYSEGDAAVTNAIGFSFSPWRSRPWSLHFAAEWNIGATTSYARGAKTTLTTNRLALGLEGRWMPKSRFYLYTRVMPAMVNLAGEIDDQELGVQLESSSWTFTLDASAGTALRLGTAGEEPKRTASFWLMIDWGYIFAAQSAMTFRPTVEDDDTRTFGSINLPSLRPGGFVTRASFAVTF